MTKNTEQEQMQEEGNLTSEEIEALISSEPEAPKGDTEQSESGKPDADNLEGGEVGEVDDEDENKYNADNTVILAKDNKHTISYDKLVEAKQQESQLKADYKKAQKELEQKQKELNKIAQQQGKKDEQAKIQIKSLTNELTNQLVRVRVQPEANQCSGAGASTNKDTADSEGNRSEAYGLLPEINTKRLARAIEEVETLSAAYSSCKNTLQINNK